ncbi:EamA family transporter [Marinomonas sp. A79]|uniref:EamA family transporter n=1 Tax=Marinomonas vulgaris TaxID=2823372 RepID=A0ABS5H9C3_9GAMM|nr:DMT family transporter [Marinomonas vulgaris]MBR7888281.1 EamA family transporter [Marinomonas vulgaris]
MKNQSNIGGQYFVLLSACFYGLNPFFAQQLFEDGLGAAMVSLYRFILPALFFMFCLRTPRENRLEVFRSLVLGVASGVAIFGYFHALETIPAATAILIYYSYPFFSVLIGWWLFKRTPSQNTLVSAALILIAVSLTIRPESLPAGVWLSVAACFLAPVAVATQVQYLSNPKQTIPTRSRVAWITMGHVLVLFPIAVWHEPEQILPVSMVGVVSVFGIALLAAALPQILFMLGAPRSCADRNALTGSLELVVAFLTGALLLGDPLDRFELTAMALIVLALFIKQGQAKSTTYSTVHNTA